MVVGAIADARHNIITNLLGTVTALYKRFFQPRSSSVAVCRLASHRREDCENALLGSLVKALTSEGLFPVPTADLTTASALAIYTKLSGLSFQGLTEFADHKLCNPKQSLDTELKRIWQSTPTVVTESRRNHLAEQARKTGVTG